MYDLIIAKAIQYNIKDLSLPSTTQSIRIYCPIGFSHPVFNHIPFNKIFLDFQSIFPVDNLTPKVCFKYNSPVSRKIFNYNFVSKNFDSITPSCVCSSPNYIKYVDSTHGHIITGNLDIVSNPNLRLLLSKGTKFRNPAFSNISKIISNLYADINLFISKIAQSHSLPYSAFNHWKILSMKYLEHLIRQRFRSYNSYNLSTFKNDINSLQNNFVITYVDKACNNYAFICKQFYISSLRNFLSCNDVFIPLKDSPTIISKKIIAFHKLFSCKVKNLNFPYVVLIPKFHKSPVTFRTVTIGFNTYGVSGSKILLSALTPIFNSLVPDSFVIQNSFDLVKKINSLNSISSISTYDFKDLFNNIYIDTLYLQIIQVYENYISANPNSTNLSFFKFKRLLKFVLYNNYLIHNSSVYLQIKGVPQGGSASSLLANLHLLLMESKVSTTNDHPSRYIDDLIILNTNSNSCTTSDNLLSCYDDNLNLVKSSVSNNSVNFLDLSISLFNNSPFINLYDKRSDFNFHVIKFSCFASCLHKNVFKNIIINFLLRIKRLCSPDFHLVQLTSLFNDLISYDYPYLFIIPIFKSVFPSFSPL